jgi:calcineurin-like phosphoesterase family protein
MVTTAYRRRHSLRARDGVKSANISAKNASLIRFVVLNDLHYMDKDCIAHLRGVVAKVNGLQPDFVMVLGDFVEHASLRTLRTVKLIFKNLNCPWFGVPGNHDYHAKRGRRAYDAVFPQATNYLFACGDFQFLAIDTCVGTAWKDVACGSETLASIKKLARRLNSERPTVLFTHFPLAKGVKYCLTNAEAILELFEKQRLIAVFGGHFHGTTRRRLGKTALYTCVGVARARENHDGTAGKGFLFCQGKAGRVKATFVPVEVSTEQQSNKKINSRAPMENMERTPNKEA